MKGINVLILTTDSHIGGTEKILIEFLKRVDKVKFNIYFLCLKPGGPLVDIIKKIGFKSECLNVQNVFGLIKAIFFLKKFIRRNKIQILHSYLFHSNILSRMVRTQISISVVINGQRSTDEWKKWWHILLDRWTGFLCDVIVCNSVAVCNRIRYRERHKKNKFFVIPNGIDARQHQFNGIKANVRDSIGVPQDVPLLINIGNLREPKGQIYLVQAMKVLKEKNLKAYPRVIIVGEGRLRRCLEKEIKTLGLEKDIFLLGFREDIANLLGASDIFVFSSLWEGMPVAVMEAMAAGRPVVATNVGGIPEIVQDNKTGVLVPPRNPTELANAIERLLNNPEIAIAMGRSGKGFIEDNYSIEKMVKDTERLYIELLYTTK